MVFCIEQVLSPLLKHGVINVEARLKYTHAMALIHGFSKPNGHGGKHGEFGEVGGCAPQFNFSALERRKKSFYGQGAGSPSCVERPKL